MLFLLSIIILCFDDALAADSNCDNGVLQPIYGICGSIHCSETCDFYCNFQDTNSTNNANADCCCDDIIKSGLNCNTNDAPCIINVDNNNSSSIIFGFQPSINSNITPSEPITLTLFWNDYRYQCITDNTIISSSFYSCDTFNTFITSDCNTYISPNTVQYGLQIDYLGTDTLDIDNIIIKQINNNIVSNLHFINDFCTSAQCTQSTTTFNISSSEANSHHLIIFNLTNEENQFFTQIQGYVQPQGSSPECVQIAANLSKTTPESINVSHEVCVFGSHHSFLDGTYRYIAWNWDVNGAIYHNLEENKYLYLQIANSKYQWEINDDILGDNAYSVCAVNINDPYRFLAENCVEWEIDLDLSSEFVDYESDPLMSVSICHRDATDVSITFEIESIRAQGSGIAAMTLFWDGFKYKCNIYLNHLDGDYSCNTLLNAIKCDSNNYSNPTQYGLQVDVFRDNEDVIANDDSQFQIANITIKYMEGNVVRDTHKIQYFCNENLNECDSILLVEDHTMVIFNYSYFNTTYVDKLESYVSHQPSLTQCIPDGYEINEQKYILVEESKSWMEAQKHCQDILDSNLATIVSTNDLLTAVTLRELNHSNEDVWIGLNDREENNIWIWVDGTSCEHTCEHDPNWSPGEPDTSHEDCVEMSGVTAYGYFNDDACEEEHIFLCNAPTPEPTNNPTNIPTFHPTHQVITQYIVITNHLHTNSEWVAFSMHQMDLTCGGHISAVEIHREFDNQWSMFTSNESGYYIFDLNISFQPPISIRITRTSSKGDEIKIGTNVITSFTGGENFDFGRNFCVLTEFELEPSLVDRLLSIHFILMGALASIFIIVGGAALLDAKFIRKNDHFQIMGIVSALFQLLDMLTDILFCMHVWQTYGLAVEPVKTEYFIIFILSVLFIIIPVGFSIFQLHVESSKQWLHENRIREWLKKYARLLYLASIFTGSSFSAIQIFNSNTFGLDAFYMGLRRDDIMRFSTNKVYSIILLENIPQLILSAFYMVVFGSFNMVSCVQIIFSIISIIATIATIILQCRIDETQDYVSIMVDISGQCIMDNLKICRNRTDDIRKYLARTVLGINSKWVEIQKPYAGGIKNGVKLQIYASFIHNEDEEDIEDRYRESLQVAIDDESLAQFIQKAWKLETLPTVGNVLCKFRRSDVQKERARTKSDIAYSQRNKMEAIKDSDDEEANLKLYTAKDGMMLHWKDMTKGNSSKSLAYTPTNEADTETTPVLREFQSHRL